MDVLLTAEGRRVQRGDAPVEQAASRQIDSGAGKFKSLGLSIFMAWEVADIHHLCLAKG